MFLIQLPAQSRSARDQTRLHKASSSYVLKTSQDGACAGSLRNLSDCLTVFFFMGEKFLFMGEKSLNLSSQFLSLASCSCAAHCYEEFSCIFLLASPYVQTCFPCSQVADRFPHRHPFSRLSKANLLQPLLKGQVLHLGGPLLTSLQFNHVFLVLGEAKTRCSILDVKR